MQDLGKSDIARMLSTTRQEGTPRSAPGGPVFDPTSDQAPFHCSLPCSLSAAGPLTACQVMSFVLVSSTHSSWRCPAGGRRPLRRECPEAASASQQRAVSGLARPGRPPASGPPAGASTASRTGSCSSPTCVPNRSLLSVLWACTCSEATDAEQHHSSRSPSTVSVRASVRVGQSLLHSGVHLPLNVARSAQG